MVDLLAMYAEIYPPDADAAGLPAGESAFTCLPHYIPIAEDGTGRTLFVDTRPGPQHGCVTSFEKDESDSYGPTWSSVETTLTETADALVALRGVDAWQPVVADRLLAWEPEDD